jgi:hypothetical protein
VTTLVCFTSQSHARLWVQRAPGIPCALCLSRRERFLQNLGRLAPRERETTSVSRHCEERSDEANPFFLYGAKMDCFADARNDGPGTELAVGKSDQPDAAIMLAITSDAGKSGQVRFKE